MILTVTMHFLILRSSKGKKNLDCPDSEKISVSEKKKPVKHLKWLKKSFEIFVNTNQFAVQWLNLSLTVLFRHKKTSQTVAVKFLDGGGLW